MTQRKAILIAAAVILFVLYCLLFPPKIKAYHEFQTPQKAYKKATLEYYSDDEHKTSPDSTVTIYYDKNGVEMHRIFKMGCGNKLTGVPGLGDSLRWKQGDGILIWDAD